MEEGKVQTTHEVECRKIGGRTVRIVLTDQIAVVKLTLSERDLATAEMAIDIRELVQLSDSVVRGSVALTGLTPAPEVRHVYAEPTLTFRDDANHVGALHDLTDSVRMDFTEPKRRGWFGRR